MKRLHPSAPALFALVILFATLAPTTLAQAFNKFPTDGWYAQYWNNLDALGDPIFTRNEPALNHYWGTESPVPGVIFKDYWAARWTRTITSDQPGIYRFIARMDDAMRVYLDETLIIDAWHPGQERALTVDVPLAAGPHTLRVDYYDIDTIAVAVLDYQRLDAGGGSFYPNWKAEYFNNPFLSGAPVLVRDEQQLNLDWDDGRPDPLVANDFFSARYTRVWQGVPGNYRFTLTSDDGSRLFINDQLLIDNWAVQDSTAKSADYYYDGSPLRLRVEFFENTGGSKIILEQLLLSSSDTIDGSLYCPTPSGSLVTNNSGSAVNIRSAPGTQNPIIGQLQPCDQATFQGYNAGIDGWIYVEDFYRQTGWVATQHLALSDVVLSEIIR